MPLKVGMLHQKRYRILGMENMCIIDEGELVNKQSIFLCHTSVMKFDHDWNFQVGLIRARGLFGPNTNRFAGT